jgi:hypothetical protein
MVTMEKGERDKERSMGVTFLSYTFARFPGMVGFLSLIYARCRSV